MENIDFDLINSFPPIGSNFSTRITRPACLLACFVLVKVIIQGLFKSRSNFLVSRIKVWCCCDLLPENQKFGWCGISRFFRKNFSKSGLVYNKITRCCSEMKLFKSRLKSLKSKIDEKIWNKLHLNHSRYQQKTNERRIKLKNMTKHFMEKTEVVEKWGSDKIKLFANFMQKYFIDNWKDIQIRNGK